MDDKLNNESNRLEIKNYSEKYEKKRPRKNLLQLVLIALLSSILGGGTVFTGFMLIDAGPVQVSVKDTSFIPGTNNIIKISDNTQGKSQVTSIAEKAGPSVVGVKVTMEAQKQAYFFNMGPGVGEGSGIVISGDGYILTNNHVVEGALTPNTNDLSSGSKIEVILPNQKDKTYVATLIGRDSESDLAVLKIDATGLVKAELGDSNQLKVGELAVAIGNPGGFDYMGSVTAGIISGLNRTLKTANGNDMSLIQTDAAINPGNSGGALCNSSGQVIGINTVKISAAGFEGLGFAIPINHAKDIAQSLIDYKYVKGRPLIGVSIVTSNPSSGTNESKLPEGLTVGVVTSAGPAEKAGIKSGDIITKFDGKAVTSFQELNSFKDKHKPGDVVEIEIYRDGAAKTLALTLGEEKN
jgi:serine protease Do